MTLCEWAERYRWVPKPFPGSDAVTVPLGTGDSYRELWRLDDYRVSSVTGGSVWLVPKHLT